MIIFITSPPRAAPAPARTSRDLIKFNWFLSDQMQTRQFHFATFSKIGKHWACINLVSTKLSTFGMWFKIEEYKILVRYFCSLNFAPQGLDRMSHFTSNLLSTAVCLDIYISRYLHIYISTYISTPLAIPRWDLGTRNLLLQDYDSMVVKITLQIPLTSHYSHYSQYSQYSQLEPTQQIHTVRNSYLYLEW